VSVAAVVVQVIAGKDKGTIAEVEKVVPTRGLIVVKGVNIKVRLMAGTCCEEVGVGAGVGVGRFADRGNTCMQHATGALGKRGRKVVCHTSNSD
jgi:hypothetical protein